MLVEPPPTQMLPIDVPGAVLESARFTWSVPPEMFSVPVPPLPISMRPALVPLVVLRVRVEALLSVRSESPSALPMMNGEVLKISCSEVALPGRVQFGAATKTPPPGR